MERTYILTLLQGKITTTSTLNNSVYCCNSLITHWHTINGALMVNIAGYVGKTPQNELGIKSLIDDFHRKTIAFCNSEGEHIILYFSRGEWLDCTIDPQKLPEYLSIGQQFMTRISDLNS